MDDYLQSQFGKGLKKLRKLRRLTQEGLAGRCCLNRSYISTLERNKKMPSLHTISVLAAGLDMKAYELIKEIEEYPDSINM